MERLDIVIKNGVIVDGTGNPWFYGDIGILNDKIVYVGRSCPYKADNIIDARGLIVTPGFIDIHNHSDITIFSFPEAENLVLQGVTTVVCGNCGFSPAPALNNTSDIKDFIEPFLPEGAKLPWSWGSLGLFLNAVESIRPGLNMVQLIGHGTLRINIMGFKADRASEDEINAMVRVLRDSLNEGGWGLSFGLLYPPGAYAELKELVALARAVREYSGFCSIHLRNESSYMIEALLEALKISVNSGTPLEISHHKAAGKENWGLVKTSLEIIRHYRSMGVDVTVDVYPYTAGCTSLSALLPPWVHEGGLQALLERIRKPEIRERIAKELKMYHTTWENLARATGWENIILTNLKTHKEYNGKSILEVANMLRCSPVDVILDILLDENGSGEIILHSMSEHDVELVIRSEFSMIGSDSWAWSYNVGGGHPRMYATYPRFFRMVRERKILTLEKAILKTSSMPAWRIGLLDRGILRPGFYADIVVFDFNEIKDMNDYANPAVPPKGIKYVIINGKITVENGRLSSERHGRVLRRKVRELKLSS